MARILLGVAGSIAAYRSVDLVKHLLERGHEVEVVLTRSAKNFVTSTSLETFLGKKILSNDPWDDSHVGTSHIAVARSNDLILIYGATTHYLAKLAAGLCDDFLSLQVMATKAPVILVPAMNVEMWKNAIHQGNLARLQTAGFRFVGPVNGRMACGETGLGHIASFDEIESGIREALSPLSNELGRKILCSTKSSWKGRKVLITLGSMKTDIDDIRFIQNKSSGRLGLEIAKALALSGAELTLVAGLIVSEVEEELQAFRVLRYESFEDYKKILLREFPGCEVFLSLAAVLDFEVRARKGKIERGQDTLTLNLRATEDIVKLLASNRGAHQRVIAFSLESGSDWALCEQRALKKLRAKGADAIVLNRAGLPGEGPDSKTTALKIILPDGSIQDLGNGPKFELSTKVLDSLSDLFGFSARPEFVVEPTC